MRQENPKELGTWPFEIGLWVGSGATPNYMGKPGDEFGVVSKVLEYKQGTDEPPAGPSGEMPLVRRELHARQLHLHPDQDNAEELRITCLGDDCDFTGDRSLPIHMVDEPIYNRLPGFLIATVDKFAGDAVERARSPSSSAGSRAISEASASWAIATAQTGVELDDYLPPPELVIQDELHLISGPLGTIAGPVRDGDRTAFAATRQGRGPKIVSSTATVRRATDQIRALFGRSSVQIFPPPGPESATIRSSR